MQLGQNVHNFCDNVANCKLLLKCMITMGSRKIILEQIPCE